MVQKRGISGCVYNLSSVEVSWRRSVLDCPGKLRGCTACHALMISELNLEKAPRVLGIRESTRKCKITRIGVHRGCRNLRVGWNLQPTWYIGGCGESK